MNYETIIARMLKRIEHCPVDDFGIVEGKEHLKDEQGYGPDIRVTCYVGTSEGAEVSISLYDLEMPDEDGTKVFDAEIPIGNDDSTDPLFMSGALIAVLDKFYAQGLDKRWGRLVGDWDKVG